MEAKVLKEYIDKETKALHTVGEVVELSDARAEELTKGGYVAALEEKTPKTRKAKK